MTEIIQVNFLNSCIIRQTNRTGKAPKEVGEKIQNPVHISTESHLPLPIHQNSTKLSTPGKKGSNKKPRFCDIVLIIVYIRRYKAYLKRKNQQLQCIIYQTGTINSQVCLSVHLFIFLNRKDGNCS